jgi:5-methylcytosine-specific restriction endonuclease McrA
MMSRPTSWIGPDGREIQMTIDHIIERQANPGRALDPSNLRIAFTRENTFMLRRLNELDPFLDPANYIARPGVD